MQDSLRTHARGDLPSRSSMVDTSASFPPGTGALHSGLLQLTPARTSLEFM